MPRDQHTPSLFSVPDGQMARSGGQAWKAYHKPVNAYAGDPKKSNGLHANGPTKLLSTPPKTGPSHPFFLYFVYFSLFILSYLI